MHPYRIEAGTDLSLAELTAARLDGDVVEFGDTWIPTATIDTPWLRAQSLATMLGPDLAAIEFTAAWVHGALRRRPARLSVRRACERRLTPVIRTGVDYHDARLDPADLVRIGAVAVSTLARTAVDIARIDRAAARGVLAALERQAPGTIDLALDWITDHPGAVDIRPARRRLISVRRQEEVTR